MIVLGKHTVVTGLKTSATGLTALFSHLPGNLSFLAHGHIRVCGGLRQAEARSHTCVASKEFWEMVFSSSSATAQTGKLGGTFGLGAGSACQKY